MMTNNQRRGLTIGLLSTILLLIPALARASDTVITYPPGWQATHLPPYAANGGRFAVALHHRGADRDSTIDRSLVLLADTNGIAATVEFDGKVFDMDYSPLGGHVLVHRVGAPDLIGHEIGVTLLAGNGRTQWSRAESNRMLYFSMSGRVLYAWNPGDYNPMDRGRAVEILDSGGQRLAEAAYDKPVVGVIVPDDGSQVIFATPRFVVCLSTKAPVGVAWRVSLPADSPDIVDARPIGAKRFSVQLSDSRTLVVNVNGEVEYPKNFDDPNRQTQQRGKAPGGETKGYRVTADTTGGAIFFDGTPKGWSLNFAEGRLRRVSFDTEVPAGYLLGNRVLSGQLFFFSEQDARVRAIHRPQ